MAKYKMIRDSVQFRFNQCRKKVQIMAGGFGNGKSAAACVKAIGLAMDYPGSNGLVARESYVKLNDTVRKEFYKWIPHDAVARWPTTTDNTMILKNGSTINFRYIAQRGKKSSDGQSTSNLLSATYDWVVVDQIEDPQIMHKDFLDLLGRLRGSTPYKGTDPTMPMSGPRWLILTANPSANWVYSKLIKPLHQWKATGLVTEDLIHDPNTMEPLIELFEGSTHENSHNLDADFIQGLEAAYKGQMRRRFLMGEWAAFEGLVYPEFSTDMHMIKHSVMEDLLLEQLHDRTRYIGIEGFDLGITEPSCYLIGFVDEIGRIFVIDGFYEPGLTTDVIYEKITALQQKYAYGIELGDPIWGDPAIFRKTQLSGLSVSTVGKILTEKGLYIKGGQNDIKNGIMKVNGYLAIQPEFHFLDPSMAGAGIYFSDHLTFISDEFLTYFWKTNELGTRIDEPNGKNDHAMDTLKYMLSRIPDPSTLQFRKPPLTPEHFKWHERA